MSENEKAWHRFSEIIRKARNDCPLSPEEAQKELDALSTAETSPLSSFEIERMIAKVLDRDFEPEKKVADTGWVDSYGGNDIEADVLVLNRNKGDTDPEVEAKLEELRKKVDDEEGEQDEPGRADSEKPSGEGS